MSLIVVFAIGSKLLRAVTLSGSYCIRSAAPRKRKIHLRYREMPVRSAANEIDERVHSAGLRSAVCLGAFDDEARRWFECWRRI
jgi:hypothetical protein